MSLFVGLDISVKTTAMCILDASGRVLLEGTVDSAADAIAERLCALGHRFERIGLEAGPLSQWIYAGLVDIGLPATCSKPAICTLPYPRGSIRLTGTVLAESPR